MNFKIHKIILLESNNHSKEYRKLTKIKYENKIKYQAC